MQGKEIENFMVSVMEASPQNGGKLLLLLVTLVHYPLFVYCGSRFLFPVLIRLCSDYEAERLIGFLTGFGIPPVISLAASPKEIRRIMGQIDYGYAVFRWNAGRYTKENLQYLRDMAGSKRNSVFPIVIAVNCHQKGYEEQFAGEIHFDEEDCRKQLPETIPLLWDIIPYAQKRQMEIRRWIREAGNETKAFLVSGKLMMSFFENVGLEAENVQAYRALIMAAEQKIEESWEGGDPGVVAELFRKVLFDLAESIPLILDRKRIPAEYWGRINEAILFDAEAYYLTESMFQEAYASLHGQFSISDLKSWLRDAEMLVCEGRTRKYGTLRVWITNSFGESDRVRRVKLLRTEVDRNSDLSLIETMGGSEV